MDADDVKNHILKSLTLFQPSFTDEIEVIDQTPRVLNRGTAFGGEPRVEVRPPPLPLHRSLDGAEEHIRQQTGNLHSVELNRGN